MKPGLRLLLLGIAALPVSACRTSTDYPYNPNSVTYYQKEPIPPKCVVIPYHRSYAFDHQKQGYYHETPIK